MLRQKENRTGNRIDKTMETELSQVGSMLSALAKQQMVTSVLQKLASKNFHSLEDTSIKTAIIFLTERKLSQSIKTTLKWIGIDKELGEEVIFNGSTNGTLNFSNALRLQVQLFHFDQYPMQKLSDDRQEVKIIIYDSKYKANYKNWNLALEILQIDASVILAINVTDDTLSLETEIEPDITNLTKKNLIANRLEDSFKSILSDEMFIQHLQLVRQKNYIEYIQKVYRLIRNDFHHKEDQLIGKSIITTKKQLQNQANEGELSTKEVSFLKSKVDQEFKQISKFVEEKTDNFDKEEPQYKELEEEIISFFGFVEKKGGKYITLKIAEGAIKDKTNKSGKLLSCFFNKTLEKINDKIKKTSDTIKQNLDNWSVETHEIQTPDLDQEFTNEILVANNPLPDKPYEKQITYKGIGGLLMELRTPLFMLMPFMMIFALFGALVGSEDVGIVDESVLFYQNRPCIAINQLPESRENAFRGFIEDIESYRDPKKGVFDKEISGELLTEPQLAVKTIQVPQSFGNKLVTKETLDYHFDSKERIVYLFLKENADRNFVIQKLYDPSLKLLSIPSSNRRGFGIGGLIRALSGLSDYRYLILIGLVSLLLWFVVTRKGSMDAELKAAKNKEKQKLNSDLKQHIEKNMKQSIQKWRSKIVDELTSIQNQLFKTAEKTLNKAVEVKKQQKTQESKVIQKRLTSIKNEKSKLSSLKSEHRKISSKLDQLETKAKRMMRLV